MWVVYLESTTIRYVTRVRGLAVVRRVERAFVFFAIPIGNSDKDMAEVPAATSHVSGGTVRHDDYFSKVLPSGRRRPLRRDTKQPREAYTLPQTADLTAI